MRVRVSAPSLRRRDRDPQAMDEFAVRKHRRNLIGPLVRWLRRVTVPPMPPPGHLMARAQACDATLAALVAAAGVQQRLEAEVRRAQLAAAESERHRASLKEALAAAEASEQGCGMEVLAQRG